jgi:DNA-directed RNA polymerase specialized sigma24 family protein
LVGRKYEYSLDLERLLNTRTPEVIEEQGERLTDLFRRHSEIHLKVPSSSTVSKWRQTFKGMLSEGYDYKSVSRIIAYLPLTSLVKVYKSPIQIKRNFAALFEEASRNLSKRKAQKYLYKLANDLLYFPAEPIPAAVIPEVMPSDAPEASPQRKTVYTSKQWEAVLEWTAELDEKGLLRKWYYKCSFYNPGIDVSDFRSIAQEYMLKHINGETKTTKTPNCWLRYRLRGYMHAKRALDELYIDDDVGDGENEGMNLEKYGDIAAFTDFKEYKDNLDEIIMGEADMDDCRISRITAALKSGVIQRALDTLPENDKAIAEGYYGFNGDSYTEEELAEKHNCSISNISRILTVAKDKLKIILENDDEIKKYLRTDRGDSPP